MHWTQTYIGIPYSNMNCAELVVCIQREVFNRTMFRIPQPQTENLFHYNYLMQKHMWNFLEEKKIEPHEGCCVIMKAMKRMCHVGVFTVINGKQYVIHSMDSFGSAVMHQIKDLWRHGIEIEGFHAWKS